MSDLSEVSHCADTEAVLSTGTFLNLSFRADCTICEFGGALLGLLVLIVDEVPLFLVGFMVLFVRMLLGLVVLVIIDPLLHTAGDAQCTLGVPDVVTKLLDFLCHLILSIFDGLLLLRQLPLLLMQLLRLPLNLFGLCNLFLLLILFLLVSQRVQSLTLLLGLGLSLFSFLSPFVQLVTEFLEFLVFGLDFLINLSFLLNQDGLG